MGIVVAGGVWNWGGATVSDDKFADPYHPSRAQAGPLSDGNSPATPEPVPGSPAEAQFPYLATQGIQATPESSPASPEPVPPRLRNRRPARQGSGRWLPALIGVASGVFVLGVLGAYLTWGAGGNPMASPTPPATADATPHGAVRGYLQALSAADADAALGFALTPPADPTMLTDEVLAALMSESPITAIEVREAGVEAVAQQVTAVYLLGNRAITAEFEVVRQNEVWRLETVAAEVALDLPLGELPLTLNGVPLATTTPSLFPGHYELATTASRYTVEESDFTVESPVAPPVVEASLGLSEEGRAEVIAAAETKLAACVKQRDLEPEDCGFSITSPKGTKLRPSTMRWSVHSGGELADLEVTLDHPGSATAAVDIDIRGTVKGADGSRWQSSDQLTRMRADLTGDEVTVQFA